MPYIVISMCVTHCQAKSESVVLSDPGADPPSLANIALAQWLKVAIRESNAQLIIQASLSATES